MAARSPSASTPRRRPFDNVALRQAINAALDRDQIVNLAYEGSVVKADLPFSSYKGMLPYVSQLQDLMAPLDQHSPEKVAETHGGRRLHQAVPTASGPTPTARPLQLEVQVAQGDPVGPVLGEQLHAAGFDALIKRPAGHGADRSTGCRQLRA
jgi:peptide/nickel transport system substrate-binding protein